jgi:hypothetical protein
MAPCFGNEARQLMSSSPRFPTATMRSQSMNIAASSMEITFSPSKLRARRWRPRSPCR